MKDESVSICCREGEEVAVTRMLLGKIMTGFWERRGRSWSPEEHKAAQVLCSSVQIVAVRAGEDISAMVIAVL